VALIVGNWPVFYIGTSLSLQSVVIRKVNSPKDPTLSVKPLPMSVPNRTTHPLAVRFGHLLSPITANRRERGAHNEERYLGSTGAPRMPRPAERRKGFPNIAPAESFGFDDFFQPFERFL
jgi:hypothetical protein